MSSYWRLRWLFEEALRTHKRCYECQWPLAGRYLKRWIGEKKPRNNCRTLKWDGQFRNVEAIASTTGFVAVVLWLYAITYLEKKY